MTDKKYLTNKEALERFRYNETPATSTKPNAGMVTLTRKDTAAPMPEPAATKKKIDHKYTDEIVCPYCGSECTDSWEYKGDSDEIECGECEKPFTYERLVTVEYCTSKIKPKPENANP